MITEGKAFLYFVPADDPANPIVESEQTGTEDPFKLAADQLRQLLVQQLDITAVRYNECWMKCIGKRFQFPALEFCIPDDTKGKWIFQLKYEEFLTDIHTSTDIELKSTGQSIYETMVTSIQLTDLISGRFLWRTEAMSEEPEYPHIKIFIDYKNAVDVFNRHLKYYTKYIDELLYLKRSFKQKDKNDHPQQNNEIEQQRQLFKEQYGHDFRDMKDLELMGEFRHDGRFWPNKIIKMYWDEDDVYLKYMASKEAIFEIDGYLANNDLFGISRDMNEEKRLNQQTTSWITKLMNSCYFIVDRSSMLLNSFIEKPNSSDRSSCYGVKFVFEQSARFLLKSSSSETEKKPYKIAFKEGTDIEQFTRLLADWAGNHQTDARVMDLTGNKDRVKFDKIIWRVLRGHD
jgi:hypothetical protein